MKHYIKLLAITLIIALSISSVGFHQHVFAQPNLDIKAKSAILVDASSGKILYAQNPDEHLAPASMTKMMTEYLVLESINSGKINWDDVVTASEYAHWIGGSRVYLALGGKHTVRELTEAMAVYSANDATVALAEYLAGSETNFVDLMNEKAEEFGMANTHFVTSTGYPASDLGIYAPPFSGDNYMSARDAAILAYHLVNDYPEILTITNTPTIDFDNLKNLLNWNWMIKGTVSTYEYPGVDGLKTGHTEEAGYNFTGTAKRNGIRLITVVMGTDSKPSRFLETKKLFDYGFVQFGRINLLKDNQQVPGYKTVEVENGVETEVPVVTKGDLNVLVKKGEEDLYKPVVHLNESIAAPIKSGDSLGYIDYNYSGKEKYDYLNDKIKEKGNISLVANEDVEKASSIRLFFRKILNFFKSIYNGIVSGF